MKLNLSKPKHEIRERIYHHYGDLEEYRDGMWRIVRGEERKRLSKSAADLMRNSVEFEAAMMRVLDTWGNSCEHNLSAENINRIAWLEHAGCCIAVSSPEENTRCGWHSLSQLEQDEANKVAAKVLLKWDAANAKPDLFGEKNA